MRSSYICEHVQHEIAGFKLCYEPHLLKKYCLIVGGTVLVLLFCLELTLGISVAPNRFNPELF